MYILKYTSIENIARRLRGRLNVNLASGASNNSAAAGTVDAQLISQVAEQIETKLELGLGQIYEMPIPQNAYQALQIIGAIAEKLIVSEIALTHFVMQINPETGADQGFGSALRKQAFDDLEVIFAGHGIFIPGLMNNTTEQIKRQPITLPGLKLLQSGDRPDTYTRNYSVVNHREISEQEKLWL